MVIKYVHARNSVPLLDVVYLGESEHLARRHTSVAREQVAKPLLRCGTEIEYQFAAPFSKPQRLAPNEYFSVTLHEVPVLW